MLQLWPSEEIRSQAHLQGSDDQQGHSRAKAVKQLATMVGRWVGRVKRRFSPLPTGRNQLMKLLLLGGKNEA